MKNITNILLTVLIVAVGILYYLHFSTIKNCDKKIKSPIAKLGGASNAAFAYVELDSLNEKIKYINDNRKALEAEQMSIETEWQNGYRNLDMQKNGFLKKGGSSITQEQAEEFQGILLQQQQQIDSKKQMLTQKLNEKNYKFMQDIQNKLKAFLVAYNEDKKFTYIFTTGNGLEYMAYKDTTLNITNDVIEGMNEKFKQDK